jgi:hypothetical protein
LPPGKTLDSFDFEAVPVISKAQVMALAAGDAWLNNGANLLLFGPPGGGKSHLAAALGFALVENGWRVLFTRTIDLVQRLQIARRELALEAAIAKLDKFHLLILDDIAYVTKDQAETSVLFELISARYERRSLLITANQPFGEWGKIFPDQAALRDNRVATIMPVPRRQIPILTVAPFLSSSPRYTYCKVQVLASWRRAIRSPGCLARGRSRSRGAERVLGLRWIGVRQATGELAAQAMNFRVPALHAEGDRLCQCVVQGGKAFLYFSGKWMTWL